MSRWKVERLRIGPEGELHPSGCWQVRGPHYYVNRIIPTHAEAMALADKLARKTATNPHISSEELHHTALALLANKELQK